MTTRTPRSFYQPLAIGAPQPFRDLPARLERMIHFVPPHIEKVRARAADLATDVDVLLGNLEDAVPVEAKEAARAGFIQMAMAGPVRLDGVMDAHQCARQSVGT